MKKSERLAKYYNIIGGIHCSFCAENIKRSLMKLKDVKKVYVSLAHEEILVEYDPEKLRPWQIEETLRELGYMIYDSKRLEKFKREKAELKKYLNLLIGSSIPTFLGSLLMVLM